MSAEELKTSKPLIPEKAPLKEQQQLSKLLAKCMFQVEVALTLQPDRVSDSEDLSLTRSLQTHHRLCEGLERAGQDARVDKADRDACLKKQVKNSFKNVFRCCKDIPSPKIKQACDTDMGEIEQLFFDNFKAVICNVLEREEEEEVGFLKVTPVRAPKGEATLDETIARLTKYITNTDAKIMDCKDRFEELNKLIEREEPFKPEDYKSYMNTPQMISLQNELDQLNVQLKKLILENREHERDIKEGTDMVEGEIKDILQKFDETMEVMQADLEVKEEELQRLEEKIHSLDKPLAALQGEYEEVLARRDKADMMMREEQELLVAKTKAALIAQSWWRGYCVRKAIKNKDKKGKGKKGKGRKK